MDWPRLIVPGLKAAAMGSLIGTSIPSVLTLVISALGAVTGGLTGFFWWRYARQRDVELGLSRLDDVFR